VRAVSGFDATFSAPKSLSVWWALTGDDRLLEAHDVAVTAALTHLERFGSTTRVRSNGGRLHPDTNGLTIATFRQTTSRADDPQIHTHAVISAKVQTPDGRWLALDARYLKRHQRMLGGLYQSVLRAELTHRCGVDWGPIVNGQAEIAGVPNELLDVFSKRSVAISAAMVTKLDEFRQREGREPSRYERAALEREASADTRSRKSGHGAADLATRWQTEAADIGWTVGHLDGAIEQAASNATPVGRVTVADVVGVVSAQQSSWGRPDVVRAICDGQRPVSQLSGHRWAAVIERAADTVLDHCVDLDPPGDTARRESDGRSVWIEPTAPRFTSETTLAQEEHIVTWAMDAQADPPTSSTTVDRTGLDGLQGDAAAAVAGHDRLVLVVGPAGAGKTRMLAAAAHDMWAHGREVYGVAPTARAARTVERDTGIRTDTAAKLLHEWQRTDRPPLPEYQLGPGATVVVDEAGMLTTPALDQLVTLAESNQWRLALIGDPRQLQGVGRGGLLDELCANGRVDELERLHRFTHRWEAAASLQLRSGDPQAFDAYEAQGRIIPGTVEEHLVRMAATWISHHEQGQTVALVASSNEHVERINRAVQHARYCAGHLDADTATRVAGGETVCVGDVVATRRNVRRRVTTGGEPVRNRDSWTVTAIDPAGALTVSHRGGHGAVTLPADYTAAHVRLGYAATEHGWQSDTVTTAVCLASPATTRRGLYVAATRGRDENLICVITDSNDLAEARDVLDSIVAVDRADIPATTQRRTLAQSAPRPVTPPERAPTPRRQIPDWFTDVVADTQRAVADAETRQAQQAARRAQATITAAAADRVLAEMAGATAADRDALRHAEVRAVDARRRLTAAQHRLDTAPRRWRRSQRHDLHTAQQQLDRADDYLERTRQRTGAAVERHAQAVADQRHAHAQLRTCDTIERLDATLPSAGEQRHHLRALTTWQHWAQGHDLPDGALRAAYAILARQPGAERQLAALLHPDLPDTPIERRPHRASHADNPGPPHARHDLGIEL
jgi:conjugative relaxase-like TrwC/TraI family protein